AAFAAAKSATETIKPKRVAVRWHNLFSMQLSERLSPTGLSISLMLQAPFHMVSGFGSNEKEISHG
ncbi:MAG TPA: hypothetical protein VFH87_01470, partial [Candidatus Udaeobacter sp.]|nr:hypothetical protein [Candidatus Udaeobacter sp.]